LINIMLLSNNNKVGNPTIKSVTKTIELVTEFWLTYKKVVNSSL
jgi:hypothetical protein